jgi:hypothetical protein
MSLCHLFQLVASIGATRAISVEFAVTIVAGKIAGAIVIIADCALVLGLVPFGRRPKLEPAPWPTAAQASARRKVR